MVEAITAWLAEHGYAAVFGLMVAENLFPPIPSELIVPLVGYLVATGQLSASGAFIAAAAGALVGAAPWYIAGRMIGRHRLRQLIIAAGPWLGVTVRDLARAQGWFSRAGWQAVLLGRIVPGIRTLVSLPAGLFRMPPVLFALLTGIGSCIWIGILMAAGFVLAANYAAVGVWLDPVATALLALIVVSYGVRVIVLLKQRGSAALGH